MFKKVISATLALGAIALSADLLTASESKKQDSARANTVFVCAAQTQPPTLFAYTPGEVNLTSLMSWHQDYLLPEQSGDEICQQVATKLQNRLQNQQPKLFVSQKQENRSALCLVTEENQNCDSEGSEELFSVKPEYDATCVLDNRKPLECLAIAQNRGVLGVPQSAYSPNWTFWRW